MSVFFGESQSLNSRRLLVAQILSFMSAFFGLVALVTAIIRNQELESEYIARALAWDFAWLLPFSVLAATSGLLIRRGYLDFVPWALGTSAGLQLLILASGAREFFVVTAAQSTEQVEPSLAVLLVSLDFSFLATIAALVLVITLGKKSRSKSDLDHQTSSNMASRGVTLRIARYLTAVAGVLGLTSLVLDFSSEYSNADVPLDLVLVAGATSSVYFLMRNRLVASTWSLAAVASAVLVVTLSGPLGALPVVGSLISAIQMGEYGQSVFISEEFIRGISFYMLIAAFILVSRFRKTTQLTSENESVSRPRHLAKRFIRIGAFAVGLSVLTALVRLISSSISTYWDASEFLASWVIFVAGAYVFILAISALIADAALKKGRSWPMFFWLSALVSPVLMAIIVAAISPAQQDFRLQAEPKSTTANSNVAEKLRNLEELKSQGLITADEFKSRRQKILDNI
jgi:hypothetical protein